MRIIILTSIMRGIASRVLPALCENKSIDIVKVILAYGLSPNRKKNFKRKIYKISKKIRNRLFILPTNIYDNYIIFIKLPKPTRYFLIP